MNLEDWYAIKYQQSQANFIDVQKICKLMNLKDIIQTNIKYFLKKYLFIIA